MINVMDRGFLAGGERKTTPCHRVYRRTGRGRRNVSALFGVGQRVAGSYPAQPSRFRIPARKSCPEGDRLRVGRTPPSWHPGGWPGYLVVWPWAEQPPGNSARIERRTKQLLSETGLEPREKATAPRRADPVSHWARPSRRRDGCLRPGFVMPGPQLPDAATSPS